MYKCITCKRAPAHCWSRLSNALYWARLLVLEGHSSVAKSPAVLPRLWSGRVLSAGESLAVSYQVTSLLLLGLGLLPELYRVELFVYADAQNGIPIQIFRNIWNSLVDFLREIWPLAVIASPFFFLDEYQFWRPKMSLPFIHKRFLGLSMYRLKDWMR